MEYEITIQVTNKFGESEPIERIFTYEEGATDFNKVVEDMIDTLSMPPL